MVDTALAVMLLPFRHGPQAALWLLQNPGVGGQAGAWVSTAAGAESRHQPDRRAGPLCRQPFPGRWLRPLVLGVLPPGAGLSFRGVPQPRVRICLREQQPGRKRGAASRWEPMRGLFCLPVGAAGGSPRVAMEQGAVRLRHVDRGGLCLWWGCRISWRPFCLQLLPAAGPGWAGDPGASGWAGSSGGGRAGNAVPEGALGGGSTYLWRWRSCAPGLSCRARALSCCSLTAEFAILSFPAVGPVLGWGWESSQQSGTGACHWPRNPGSPMPCLAVFQPGDVGVGEQV